MVNLLMLFSQCLHGRGRNTDVVVRSILRADILVRRLVGIINALELSGAHIGAGTCHKLKPQLNTLLQNVTR